MTAGVDARTAERLERLPVDRHGYRVPWFVAVFADGPDFRVVGAGKLATAVAERRCWICGQALGAHLTYTVGPMCAVNRVSSEPPAHLGCADYAARTCPFLTTPHMRRREARVPEGATEPGGVMCTRNPGVVLAWTSKTLAPRQVDGGVLFDMGEPHTVAWYTQARAATRAEALTALDDGRDALRSLAVADGDQPAERALHEAYARAVELLPGD